MDEELEVEERNYFNEDLKERWERGTVKKRRRKT